MTQFVGTHFGKLDRKGRISVPAIFRAELDAAATNQLVFRISHQHPCIEARSRAVFQHMLESILALEHFSEDRDALEAGIVADSTVLRLDGEGRLVLPEDMIGTIALGESIAFLGKGDRFEIWDAEAARAHVAEAKRRVLEKRLTLAATPLHPNPRGVA
ncbi:division/cell wall cluster transcriptional repressor MraZ [Falsiroseomonas sp. CW058]|uniref:division/cell wall cluster transcriptional repressor MraZ n=1 Tax=Falsiroseomonas sp. CW058 TaxID=3388664 RepID=UPI003D31355B